MYEQQNWRIASAVFVLVAEPRAKFHSEANL